MATRAQSVRPRDGGTSEAFPSERAASVSISIIAWATATFAGVLLVGSVYVCTFY